MVQGCFEKMPYLNKLKRFTGTYRKTLKLGTIVILVNKTSKNIFSA